MFDRGRGRGRAHPELRVARLELAEGAQDVDGEQCAGGGVVGGGPRDAAGGDEAIPYGVELEDVAVAHRMLDRTARAAGGPV
jgi:hypothetical protein